MDADLVTFLRIHTSQPSKSDRKAILHLILGDHMLVCSRKIASFVKFSFAEPRDDHGLVALRDATPRLRPLGILPDPLFSSAIQPPAEPSPPAPAAPSCTRQTCVPAPSVVARASTQRRAALGPDQRVHLCAVPPEP